MPETKVQRSTVARKAPATRKRPAVVSKKREQARAVDRTIELSDEVLESVESGQRAAIEAVHKFVDTVDEKLPSLGDEHPSRRQEIVDAALEMADRLVHTQYDFLRKVVDSAGKALSRTDDGK
jgi:myosin-crossreactive antigen